MLVPPAAAKVVLWISLVAGVGCSTVPDVERAWAQCLAYGGSPKFMVAGELRQAECKRAVVLNSDP